MSGEAVTVVLIPRAAGALDTAAGLLGLSRTDVINRAVQLYAFVEFERAAGAEILVRRDGVTSLLDVAS